MKKIYGFFDTLWIIDIVLLFILIGLFCFAVLKRNSIIEHFDVYNYALYDTNTPLTNHNVDLPLNTYYSCNNFCGPQSQCAITREQCTSDVDCYGCQPIPNEPPRYLTKNVRGENDAGKLIYNQNPRYSSLTTDIGTKASLYGNKLSPVPQPYLGLDKWVESANYGIELLDDKLDYTYSQEHDKYKYLPSYPTRESVTGLFKYNGPLAANAYL